MFKVKQFMIFSVNILLMLLSWIFYKFPHGDEYLVLFMISLIFIVAPYVLTPRLMAVLLSLNLFFFGLYYSLRILNPIDIFFLSFLFVGAAGASYLVMSLQKAFVRYDESNIRKEGLKYDNEVNALEVIDRKAKRIESELERISRLYEITKQLAPVLKFEDLLNTLFDFLERNFRFQTAHLLAFSKGKFSHGISKSVGDKNYYEDSERVLDYAGVVAYIQKEEFRPFFGNRENDADILDPMKVRADTFMAFPLFVGDNISAILAIEGISKSSYGRFRILIPQIAMEFRKVELYEQVQELSVSDGLTEVYLRRYLTNRLEEEVDRARRLGITFSIGMVDIDNFKKCNDKYGHLVGDAVLRRISNRLKSSVREIDMIARYGGEEFCIVLPETTKELARTVAERLRKSIESKEIKVFDKKIRTTVSIGISTYPEDGEDVATLIEKADASLYEAKHAGRNTVCVA